MAESLIDLTSLRLSVDEQGPRDAPTVVFSHPLGANKCIWESVFSRLPRTLRLIRFDTRGHGVSDAPDAPYTMGQLISDAEQLLDTLQVRDSVFVGAGFGGLVAQGLAIKRLDQIRALVLSNTAAKLGMPPFWDRRIESVRKGGLSSIEKDLTERSFARKDAVGDLAMQWRETFMATSPEGYIGCCQAISGTDFYTPTSGLRLQCLAIAGSEDRITPPDLVRETASLIPGTRFELLRRSGHFPALDASERLSVILTEFLEEIGHVG